MRGSGAISGSGAASQDFHDQRFGIVAGADGDLPIQLPTKFQLSVNLKTARALGLDIPPSVYVRAEQVFE